MQKTKNVNQFSFHREIRLLDGCHKITFDFTNDAPQLLFDVSLLAYLNMFSILILNKDQGPYPGHNLKEVKAAKRTKVRLANLHKFVAF